MPISCIQAGRELCELSGESLTHLKMQKILYYAHMIHLGKTSAPLIKNKFLAWRLGPVALGLYERIKEHGGNIVPLEAFDDIKSLDRDKNPSEFKALKGACDKLGGFTAGQLVAESHIKNGAWERTIRMRNVEILNDFIKDEYSVCSIIK